VRCAGSNQNGQLGIGRTDSNKHVIPEPVPGLANVAHVAASWMHTCALDRAGAVWCWGNDNSALGTDRPTTTPKRVEGVTATSIVVAGDRTLALTTSGDVVAWGQEPSGKDQCGYGDGPKRPCAITPVSLAPPPDVVEIAAVSYTTCARQGGSRLLPRARIPLAAPEAHRRVRARAGREGHDADRDGRQLRVRGRFQRPRRLLGRR
jgi:alpha-tubulin suppressor-like RCC1 family protein